MNSVAMKKVVSGKISDKIKISLKCKVFKRLK